jgi:hypothetical protein
LEFEISTDLSLIQPQHISSNVEALKKWALEVKEKYSSVLITEESRTDGKKYCADINNVIKAIDARRISAKKEYMAPFTEFEAQCKEVTGILTETHGVISAQVKAFEEKEKAEKQAILKAHFLQNAGNAIEYITYDEIADPKWMNKTVPLETACEQMSEILARYKEDAASVNQIVANCDAGEKTALLDTYKAHKSVAEVLRKQEAIRQQRASEAAIKAAKEQAEQKRHEQQETQVQELPFTDAHTPQPETDYAEEDEPKGEEMEICFWVRGTKEQFGRLRVFLQDNGMKYGKA